MELAASWARSPVKAVRNRRRIMRESAEADASKLSPIRIMDFPTEDVSDETDDDDDEAMDDISSSDRAALVRTLQVTFDAADIDAPQEIIPIQNNARRKQRKIKILPTLDEQANVEEFFPACINTVVKSKRRSHLPKPSMVEKLSDLVKEAVGCAGIGDEEEAIKVYKKGIRMADTEITKLKGQLKKSLEKHPATLATIQTRIQEDMLELVLLAGKIKTDVTNLYERQGDYYNAIETAKEARSIYRKQLKRSPQPGLVPDRPASPVADSPTATSDIISLSPRSNGSVSYGSKYSSESDRSIIWYVACPDLEMLILDANNLVDRLTQAHSTYEDRKKMIEEILLLRQEIAATFDAKQRRKLFDRAESMAKNAIMIERTTLGASHPQVADTLLLLSAITLEQQKERPGCREKAIQYLQQGLEINQTTLGKMHPRTGQDLLRMARVYQQPAGPVPTADASASQQNDDRAIDYFRQAADVYRGVKNGYKVVGSILNDLSVMFVGRRDFHEALALLQESLANYEADADEEGSQDSDDSSDTIGGICIDVVQVWRNMGECHMNLKDFQQAIEAFINALEAQREARRKHDSVSESDDLDSVGDEKSFMFHLMRMINDESIADTLRRLGKAFAAGGKFHEAMVVYREARQIHRTAVHDALVLARFRVNPELPGKQDQLANTLFCIAEVSDSLGDFDGATRIFNESMQLRIASDGRRPESQRCNMVHCAMCLVGIANVYLKRHEYVEAHRLYNSALFFCEAQGTNSSYLPS